MKKLQDIPNCWVLADAGNTSKNGYYVGVVLYTDRIYAERYFTRDGNDLHELTIEEAKSLRGEAGYHAPFNKGSLHGKGLTDCFKVEQGLC